MTKRQFMEELRSSLEGMVSQAVIQENMNYYEDYINEQIRNGKKMCIRDRSRTDQGQCDQRVTSC